MEQTLPLVINYLPIRDIVHLCSSSKSLLEFLRQHSLWASLIHRDFTACKPTTCPLFKGSCTPSKLPAHYREHYETSFSHGLGLHLSSDVVQISVGNLLTLTTTIYNHTSIHVEIPVGYSHIGHYYEAGALMRSEWQEKGCRRAVYSLHSPCLQSAHILAMIPPGSFVQYQAKAKLRDLVLPLPFLSSSAFN